MRVQRDRDGFSVAFLSRVGSFLRRPSLIDRYGSNPRPLTDIQSPYEALPRLTIQQARRQRKPSLVSARRARISALASVAIHGRRDPSDA